MLVYIRWGVRTAPQEQLRVCGAAVTLVQLARRRGEPAFLLRRRIRRLAHRLVRQGARLCVFPAELPCADELLRAGLRPPDELRFRRALLLPLTEAALDALSLPARRTTLAVWGDALDPQTEEALTALCRRVRHLVLDMRGADDFCRRMRYLFGVSVQRAPLPAGSGTAQLALALDAREGEAHCPVLPFCRGAEGVCVEYRAPQSVLRLAARDEDIAPLCAALWEHHALRPSDIAIAGVTFSKLDNRVQKQYNISRL